MLDWMNYIIHSERGKWMEFQMNGILNIADFVKFSTFKEIEKKFAKIIPFWNTQSSDKEFLWVMSKSIFFGMVKNPFNPL